MVLPDTKTTQKPRTDEQKESSKVQGKKDQSFAGTMDTPWRFNIAPENLASQLESNLPATIFQGLC